MFRLVSSCLILGKNLGDRLYNLLSKYYYVKKIEKHMCLRFFSSKALSLNLFFQFSYLFGYISIVGRILHLVSEPNTEQCVSEEAVLRRG